MDFQTQLAQLDQQAAAFRAAATAAGPDASVPTCPDWRVDRLVHHVARVYGFARASLATRPDQESPSSPPVPREWPELLESWDAMYAGLVEDLRAAGPDRPTWVFRGTPTAAFWARRMAHETAIHRLDAEAAAEEPLPTLVFDPEFAADGIDELLTVFVAGGKADRAGTALFHAADAGRAWHVHLDPERPIAVGPAGVTDADASVVGTADAVYRASWGRPSTAVVGGDAALLELLRAP